MKAVFNVYADPRNKAYSNYLFTLREVLEAIKLGKDFHTNIMYEMDTCWFEGVYDVYIVDQLGIEYKICNELYEHSVNILKEGGVNWVFDNKLTLLIDND